MNHLEFVCNVRKSVIFSQLLYLKYTNRSVRMLNSSTPLQPMNNECGVERRYRKLDQTY